MAKTKSLTSGKPMPLLVGFAVPLLFGLLFQQLYNVVDAAIVGRVLGADMLGAVGCTGSVNFLIVGFCNGICSGFAIPVAQCFGAEQYSRMRSYIFNSIYICAVFSIIFAAVTALLTPAILSLMGTPSDIFDYAVMYIRIIFIGIPASMAYNLGNGILRSLGDSKTPLLLLVAASLINVALDLLFIVGFGKGVGSAAAATVISQALSGIGCVVVLIKKFPILRGNSDEKKFRPDLAARLAGVGIPMGLQFSITAIGSTILQSSVNAIGTEAVSGLAAGSKISLFFTTVFDALSSAMATFAGQNIGAGKPERVNEGLKDAAIIGTAYSLAAAAVLWVFGKTLAGIFVDTAEAAAVTEYACRFLKINSCFYVMLLFVNIVRLSIQGMGHTKAAMISGTMEMIARTLFGLFVVPKFGYTAVCFANGAAWILADAFLFPCYFRIIGRAIHDKSAASASE